MAYGGGGLINKLCLAKSQTQFGSTLNLLENFCPEFENFGENFGKIPCKIPKNFRKFWISVMTSSLAKHPPPPRHQSPSFGNFYLLFTAINGKEMFKKYNENGMVFYLWL